MQTEETIDYSQMSDDELIQKFKETRKEMEYQDGMALSLKIFLNSAYGAGALSSNVFSNGRLTNASVTTAGRMLNKSVAQALNNKVRELLGEEPTTELSEIVQVDTDSNYVTLQRLVEINHPNSSEEEIMQYIQGLIKDHLQPTINKTIQEVHDIYNTKIKTTLKMDQEIVADTFCSIASKRYFANVKMSDGNRLNKDKLKITGISMISKSTPNAVKQLLKPILPMILHSARGALGEKNKVSEYIKEVKGEFWDIAKEDPSQISRSLSVNSLDYEPRNVQNEITDWFNCKKFAKFVEGEGGKEDKYQTAPVNSKASIVYNNLLESRELNTRYTNIYPGDKIKMIYLKTPNKITGFNNNVIAFKESDFLRDVKLTGDGIDIIDIDKQWEGEFINKIKIITDTIGLDLFACDVTFDEDEW